MTQAARKLSFEKYTSLDTDDWVRLGLPEGRCEYVDEEIIELPPESGINDAIANYLFFLLGNLGILTDLIRPHTCELQVPVLKPKDPQTRYPDLVLLREEHLSLTARRLTITLEMPPPQLVVEVVSSGQSNRERDYKRKREQYAQRGIVEYWLIDPEPQTVLVLALQAGQYMEVGTFAGEDLIQSPVLPELAVTVRQILTRGRADCPL